MSTSDLMSNLATQIKQWALELGFSQVGICDTDLASEETRLQHWLDQNMHGEMAYMSQHGMLRARPAELLPGTQRVIMVRMDYLPSEAGFATNLSDPTQGYISRYALGRDYHKVIRKKLQQLAEKIQAQQGALGYRPFVDSAPILERPLAAKAGLGYVGKHSLLLNHQAGSWFFIGELLVDLPLPIDQASTGDCGNCVACITMCPTQAIVAPYVVDAKRCISYLTIELKGSIPVEFRTKIGNRIYGCDDCQLVCPVNRTAPLTAQADFERRHHWQDQSLISLFLWDEDTFLKYTEGSAIRRIGYQRWQRNIAVALGNAPYEKSLADFIAQQLNHPDALVREHLEWANQQMLKKAETIAQQNRQQQRLIRIIHLGLPRDA